MIRISCVFFFLILVLFHEKSFGAYVEGGVASQVNNSSGLFGNYATGGGKQFYFLDEDKALFQVIEDIPNPKGN